MELYAKRRFNEYKEVNIHFLLGRWSIMDVGVHFEAWNERGIDASTHFPSSMYFCMDMGLYVEIPSGPWKWGRK